jgi:DNA recombination protein RmuC
MTAFGYAILCLAVGVAIGATLMAVRRRGPTEGGARDRVEARLDLQAAEIRRLADGVGSRDALGGRLQDEMAAARRALEELTIRDGERRRREAEDWEVVRRLSTVLAGGEAKGRAGENLLRQRLSELPPGMLATDFRVNGKVVEFCLQLPDGRRLPVDSKWPAVGELEALERTDDPGERDIIARDIERLVAARAREVAGYLDPALTAPVAVAAVPDAAYAVIRRAHADAFAKGVVIVPYSTALPILLFLYTLVARFGDAGDVLGALSEVASLLDAMESILENKIVRGATMIGNGADEFRSNLGKARGSVFRARVTADGHPTELSGDVLRALP